MTGYKYLIWDMQNNNADIYLNRIKTNKPVHYSDLQTSRGIYDVEKMEGIYFCDTLDELFWWLKEALEWTYIDAVELVEIQTIGEVKEKTYVNNKKAFVAESVKARVLADEELTSDILSLLYTYFG